LTVRSVLRSKHIIDNEWWNVLWLIVSYLLHAVGEDCKIHSNHRRHTGSMWRDNESCSAELLLKRVGLTKNWHKH
jgi:hypothetical protein